MVCTAQILLTTPTWLTEALPQRPLHPAGTLLKLSVIPIINENDTVVTRNPFGDNDTRRPRRQPDRRRR